jgi:non-canonical purine NTP pyrophosphatase (RdgB/HAM1 family)
MDTNSQKEDGQLMGDPVLATRNANKTREFRELLGGQFEIRDLSSFPEIEMPDEAGSTLAENAIVKAITASKHRHLYDGFVIADDSGLEVDALGGAPGIYSARYAGEPANDVANIGKLLRELRNIEKRSTRFRCAIALARAGKVLGTFDGVVEGTIVDLPRGKHGFGYDPIFQPTGFDETFGEMASDLKNQISHRAKAIMALRTALCALKN